MILRKISLLLSKYIAILLCLITLLLTTPWGTQLTLSLINNVNGVAFDYHSGSLVRDVKLNSFQLQLDTLDISVEGLSTELDFSCVWKNTLCIKSAKADYFTLRYFDEHKSVHQVSTIQSTITESPLKPNSNHQPIVLPFSIEADSIEIKKSYLVINDIEISIEQLLTQLSINKSKFSLYHPTLKLLSLTLENNQTEVPANNISSTNPVNDIVTQLPEVNLPITLIIKRLHVDDIVIATKIISKDNCKIDCQLWRSSNNQLSGTWDNTDVKISEFTTTTPYFSITKFTADAKLTPPYQINSNVVNKINNVKWWPEIADSTQKISLQGSLEALTLDVSSEGNLAIDSQVEINLVHEDMPFKLTMDAQKTPMPLSLSHYGAYSSLYLKLSGDIQKQSIELSSQVEGYGYNNAQVKLIAKHQQNHLSINKFQFNDTDSASQLDFHGDITLLPTNITWQLAADSAGFSLPQINLHELAALLENKEQVDFLSTNLPKSVSGRLLGNIATTGTWSEKKWSIMLNDTNISGKLNNVDLTIKADIGLNKSGYLQQGELFIDFNNSELSLQTASSAFWDITGQLTVDNFNHWHSGINGALTSDFSVSGKKNNPVISVNSQFTELNWQDFHSTLLQVQASYQPLSDHQILLTVNNDQLKLMGQNKEFSIDDFILKVKGNANQHQITANWLGDSTGQLALTGHWDETYTHWKSSIENSKFTYLNAVLQNDSVFNIHYNTAKQESVINSHCWYGQGLNICLPNQAIIGDSGDLTVKLNIDLSVIDELFLPKDIELISEVDGDIKVNWTAQQPIKTMAYFTLSSGYISIIDEFNENKLSQWSKGLFTFTVDENQLTNKLLLTNNNQIPLLDISSTIKLIGDYPIDAHIMLNQFDLQPFQAILTGVVNLQGKLTANISVNDTLNSPSLNGDIKVDKGKLLLSQNANTFNNISTVMLIENNQATVNGQFFIEDKEANIQGNMSWQDSLTINLDLTGHALPLIFPPELVLSISPRLNFSLIEKTLSITGDIDVLKGSYTIEKLPESSVSLSEDVIIVDKNGQTVVRKSSSIDIKTNIRVNIDKAFKIEGQGLQSHLYGQLQISQKEKHPFQLFGQIQSIDGTFEAYGQKLKIEKGELTFNGPIDNPYFNLRASRNIKAEDIDVGIQISGLADTLEMQLFSSPTMQTPEMLSYLVRGRGLDAGTGNSSAAAASILVGYGLNNSLGLFEQIEKIPLISNVSVDTEGEGDKTQATVSGYVGNRVYLKYGIGVYEPINELTVRMFVFNRFWLEIVSGIEHSSDLYYSFDID